MKNQSVPPEFIHKSELGRLLKDSKESTLCVEDELSFIRLMLRCMETGMSYSESLECVYAQLGDSINNGD
jgi:hypothetical protein